MFVEFLLSSFFPLWPQYPLFPVLHTQGLNPVQFAAAEANPHQRSKLCVFRDGLLYDIVVRH